MKAAMQRLKAWAQAIKRDVIALWLAARDPRVPFLAKAVAAVVAAYALSPIDLIPDFVPILGYLDDLLIVPAGILLAVRLIPPEVMADLRERAAAQKEKPISKVGLAMILVVWVALGAVLVSYLWPLLSERR